MKSDQSIKHIALGGVSYCGSTLISVCLGSMAGVETAGETLKTVPKPGKVFPNFTFQSDKQLAENACFICGPECEFLTTEFRQKLQRNPADWARKFANALNTGTLVTSEKSVQNFQHTYPERDHDLLILFKHPIKHWESFDRRRWREEPFRVVMNRWTRVYRELVDYQNTGKKIFLNFDNFLEQPEQIMQIICERLDLTYSDDFLRYWEHEHHYISGSFSVKQRQENAPNKLPIRQKTKPDYAKIVAEAKMTPNLEKALKMFSLLNERSVNC